MVVYNYIDGVSSPNMKPLHSKEVLVFSVGDKTTLVSFIEKEDKNIINQVFNGSMVFVENECIAYS